MNNNFFEKMLNLLYCDDIKCICCNAELSDNENPYCLCDACFKELPINRKFCAVCGTTISDMGVLCNACTNTKHEFNLSRSVLVYSNNVVKLIHNLKYNNAKYLSKHLSKILYNYFIKSSEINNVDIIIPVPLNKKRLKERGYNQSELLLTAFVKNGYNVRTDILERIIYTKTQTDLTREERLTNLNNAFKVKNKSEVLNKNILIVDDVFTTGSTINECAKTLKKAGAKCVFGLTLACANFYGTKKE